MSTNAKPPVKPIGRILYTEYIHDRWFDENPENVGKTHPEQTYELVCECKGHSADRPFSVYRHTVPDDKKPFKVVFSWTNQNYKSFTFDYMGQSRTEIDHDTYHMMDVLEEHETKTAAQKAMRRYATESFAKINIPAVNVGEVCHAVATENGKELKLRVGDLVEYYSCPGIIWKIVGERRTKYDWSLKVTPVFSLLVRDGTDKAKEISQRDAYIYVHPLDLIAMGKAFNDFVLVIQDEVRRRSE